MVKEGKIKLNSRNLTDFQASIVSNGDPYFNELLITINLA